MGKLIAYNTYSQNERMKRANAGRHKLMFAPVGVYKR
jgi:hypothetical protein